jgi:hypothetical protein
MLSIEARIWSRAVPAIAAPPAANGWVYLWSWWGRAVL